MILHVSKTKKAPEAITASGTNKNPWYHPDYFLIIKEVTSDSSKSYPVTGETVFHYSAQLFTKPTQESDCPHLPYRLAPAAGSL